MIVLFKIGLKYFKNKIYKLILLFEDYKTFISEYETQDKLNIINLNIPDILKEYTYENVLTQNSHIKSEAIRYPDKFKYSYDRLISFLKMNENKSLLTIYRKLELPNDNNNLKKLMKNYKGVGKYWTFSRERLNTFDTEQAEDTNIVILEAEVSLENIDWEETFNSTVGFWIDEREITVKEHATVNLKSVNGEKEFFTLKI